MLRTQGDSIECINEREKTAYNRLQILKGVKTSV
jgi:hypothetical protein